MASSQAQQQQQPVMEALLRELELEKAARQELEVGCSFCDATNRVLLVCPAGQRTS
jgi:hypothetical protein